MPTPEKIAVMQAFLDGETIQCRKHGSKKNWGVVRNPDPSWNWKDTDYRIKPEPREFWLNIYDNTAVSFSTEEAAEKHVCFGRTERIRVREVIE